MIVVGIQCHDSSSHFLKMVIDYCCCYYCDYCHDGPCLLLFSNVILLLIIKDYCYCHCYLVF